MPRIRLAAMGDTEPGPGASDPLTLYRSLVEGSGDLIVAFDGSGTVVFANEASSTLFGWAPAQVVGRNVFEFIHPDDLERAVRALDLNVTHGSAPGTTAFRLAHADGGWVFVDMTGGHATDDGERVLFSSFSRRADDRFAMSETLLRLTNGASLADALRPVCDTFAWQANGSQIGISWRDGLGRRGAISTGVDLSLVGGEPDAPSAHRRRVGDRESPWDRARRTGERVMDLELDQLDDESRARAEAAGLGAYWIEPIPTPTGEHALITVWTRAGGRPPLNHALAMETAPPIVEVILRWVEQQRLLDHAAFHDPLTGVANRNRFFGVLDEATGGGAVLYCDLDRFKAVNDGLGHAAGDELLRAVASRLQACVRSDDLVARLGGDEFAVLCPGADRRAAREIANRIEATLLAPFTLGDDTVSIGVSIGIGQSDDHLGEGLLEDADRELYEVKGSRRAAAAAAPVRADGGGEPRVER
jgi:diguanylate cyclase (GGDEF)-like protein/PAS domain S-box-containing protein